MQWDACRQYRLDGQSKAWKRFIHDAWSANEWWTIQVSLCSIFFNIILAQSSTQSSLPPGAVPLCLVFYADKSKLSSFGTAKGYPVIVRCANLPMNIRNGAGIGGGRVVGWLPVVSQLVLFSIELTLPLIDC